VFDQGDLRRPIVVGVVCQPGRSAATSTAEPHVTVVADNERLVLSAEREVTLRCGEASITLTRAGKVLISGTYGSYLYLKDGFALRYTLRDGGSELFRLRDGAIVFQNDSGAGLSLMRVPGAGGVPEVFLKSPDGVTSPRSNSSARRPKRKSMNSAGSEKGSLTSRGCTSQVTSSPFSFRPHGHAAVAVWHRARLKALPGRNFVRAI